jgi:hypothetical protein
MASLDSLTLRSPSIFVSYSRADLERVRALTSALRRFGVATWVDVENLRPGERWKTAIERALAGVDAMLFCLSPNSVESSWTSIELKAAIERNLDIIPIMVETVTIDRLPPALQTLQVLDMGLYPRRRATTVAARSIATRLGLRVALDGGESCDEPVAVDALIVRLDDGSGLARGQDQAAWSAVDSASTVHYSLNEFEAPILRDVLATAERARHAVLAVSVNADRGLAHFLVGALAARLGPGNLTVLEDKRTVQLFEHVASVACAHYAIAENDARRNEGVPLRRDPQVGGA